MALVKLKDKTKKRLDRMKRDTAAATGLPLRDITYDGVMNMLLEVYEGNVREQIAARLAAGK